MSDRRIAAVRDRRWRWLYDANPAGRTLTYVVRHVETDQIVGAASVFPRDVQIQGKVYKAGVLADFVTHKAHRVAGPAVMVQRAIADAHREKGLDLLFGYPNKGAAPIFPRLRFQTVCESSLWVKPLRTARKLSTYLHPVTAHLVAPFADSLLAFNDLRLASTRRTGNSVKHKTSFARLPDHTFDELWERCQGQFEVCGVKSSAFLNWRYMEHTTERYRVFTSHSRDGSRVHGYVVFSVRGNRVFVADMLSEDGYPGLESLLLTFCRQMRCRGHESVCVNYAGDPRFLTSLRAIQFVKRVGSRKLIAFVSKDQPQELRDAVCNSSAWFMHDGELDI
ncbi:MAG: GNAT family N-acetyltransferase [Polyangiaceae bacterium]|nr:GNAT family N-acetyltransferase [Polyangiaceae bacterium]